MTKKLLFFACFFLTTFYSFSQKFYPEITSERYTIAGSSRQGYSTLFDFEARTVRKGWWKFSKQFARPLNMKSYYQVTIPREMNNGNVDLILLSKSMKAGNYSKFFICLEDEQIAASDATALRKQVLQLLQQFKQTFYLERLEKELAKAEAKAARESKKADRTSGSGREKALQELTSLEMELDRIKAEIKLIYQAY